MVDQSTREAKQLTVGQPNDSRSRCTDERLAVVGDAADQKHHGASQAFETAQALPVTLDHSNRAYQVENDLAGCEAIGLFTGKHSEEPNLI